MIRNFFEYFLISRSAQVRRNLEANAAHLKKKTFSLRIFSFKNTKV